MQYYEKSQIMKNYKIAGIYLAFSYQFDTYFKGRIEQYESDAQTVDYEMRVLLVDSIEPVLLPEVGRFHNRILFNAIDHEIICFYDDHMETIEQKATYTKDYRHVTIEIVNQPKLKLPEIEYVLTGLFFMSMAVQEKMIPIHASAIALNDKAIVFSAPSKTGKSTHAHLWLNQFEHAFIINDDKPIIRIEENGVWVMGCPWSGKSAINENIALPLRALVFLSQGQANQIIDLDNKEKFIHIMRNIHRPLEQDLMDTLLITIQELINRVPMFMLSCTATTEAVDVAYKKIIEVTYENQT